jgi:hypothetical protein
MHHRVREMVKGEEMNDEKRWVLVAELLYLIVSDVALYSKQKADKLQELIDCIKDPK